MGRGSRLRPLRGNETRFQDSEEIEQVRTPIRPNPLLVTTGEGDDDKLTFGPRSSFYFETFIAPNFSARTKRAAQAESDQWAPMIEWRGCDKGQRSSIESRISPERGVKRDW